jgi:hypothetical protein
MSCIKLSNVKRFRGSFRGIKLKKKANKIIPVTSRFIFPYYISLKDLSKGQTYYRSMILFYMEGNIIIGSLRLTGRNNLSLL